MKAHLLNWVIGSACCGAFFAYAGFEPEFASVPSVGELLLAIPNALLLGGGAVAILTSLATIAIRLERGFFDWAQVRLIAAAMSVKIALIAFVFWTAVTVYQIAGHLLGEWPAGWTAAVIGACVGAALGLLAGLGVARLRIPERLGLIQPAQSEVANTGEPT